MRMSQRSAVALRVTALLVATAGAAGEEEERSKQDREETREPEEFHSPGYKLLRAEEERRNLRGVSERHPSDDGTPYRAGTEIRGLGHV